MNIDEIIEATAEALRGLDFMDGVPVFVEEIGDPDSETELAIARQQLCVVVGENGFSPTVQTPGAGTQTSVVGKAAVVVSVFEKPVVNRADEGAKTLKALSRKIGNALAWWQADGMAAPLWLRQISPVSLFRAADCDDAIITRDVVLETTAEL